MAQDTKYTPYNTGKMLGGGTNIFQNGERIAVVFESINDVDEFIVRACNSHYELLEQLGNAVADMQAYGKMNKEAQGFFYNTLRDMESTLYKMGKK